MSLWDRYRRWLYDDPASGFRLDVSRMDLPDDADASYGEAFERAFHAMEELERGGIANPDEGRMVGHYWLRAPELAPGEEIAGAIRGTLTRILAFADGVHRGRIRPDSAERFTDHRVNELSECLGGRLPTELTPWTLTRRLSSLSRTAATCAYSSNEKVGKLDSAPTDPRRDPLGHVPCRKAFETCFSGELPWAGSEQRPSAGSASAGEIFYVTRVASLSARCRRLGAAEGTIRTPLRCRRRARCSATASRVETRCRIGSSCGPVSRRPAPGR